MRRQVLHLAVPAFFALIAEPLFLLTDSAIVGHLGTAALAGLGVASAILLTVVNVFVFLAYGTTAAVARRLGADDHRGAMSAGVDGLWLSLLLGAVATLALALWAPALVTVFGASDAATEQAETYLRVSALGISPMLVVLAATGVLRGLQNTLTPLLVSVIGFSANAALSLLLVHGLHWGIVGAAWGTVIAQTGMALVLGAVVVRGARAHDAPLRFTAAGVLRAGVDGIPLVIRTLSLRAVALVTTWVAADLGEPELAAHQVALTYWGALALALDALAIAAQALTGKALGAGDVKTTRELTRLLLRWGVWFGAALAALTILMHRVIPLGFSTDPEVRDALAAALIVVALGQPIAAVAFVLDGVLIGAGDARWLAGAQTAFLVAYLPMGLAVWASGVDGVVGLIWLWVAFNGFLIVRAGGLWWRSSGETWMVTGPAR